MKFTNPIKKFFSKIPKKLLLVIVSVFLAVGVAGLVRAEFYPDRPTYDYNKPCNPNDADKYDRCGSLEGPVFNSFINTPSYGDERAFADARKSENTASGSYKNVLEDVTTGSREVVVRMYVHNNANSDTNASGKGIARDTKVRVALPTAESQTLRTRSYVSASNAAMVEDTVDLVGAQAFKVEYVPGSAIIYSNGPVNGQKLSDNIVTTGAPIGYNALDGNLPGCFDYEAVVQIRVRVIVKEVPTLKFTKQVRMAGTKEWKKEVTAKPGDKVEWLLTTQTAGTGVNNNITVLDVPAPNTSLVPGSVKWIDGAQGTVPQGDTGLFNGGGINFGNYGPNSGFYVTYGSTLGGDFKECEVRVRNLAYVKSTQVKEIGDDADVVIKKDNCQPEKPKPVYSCDLMTAEKVGDKKYKFVVNYTAKDGASLKIATFDFGDGSEKFVTDKTTTEHTYTKDGSFVARVALTFRVDGQDKVVEGDKCATPISITTPTTPDKPVTPAKELPNTGAGNLLGIFVGVSTMGAALYQAVARRRLIR